MLLPQEFIKGEISGIETFLKMPNIILNMDTLEIEHRAKLEEKENERTSGTDSTSDERDTSSDSELSGRPVSP